MNFIEGAIAATLIGAFFGWLIGRLSVRCDTGEPEGHTLVCGMVEALPAVGRPFSNDAKERWLECLAFVLDVVWPPRDEPQPDPDDPEEADTEDSGARTAENVQKIMSDAKPAKRSA